MTDSSPPSSPPPSERRRGARHIACFPAFIEPTIGDDAQKHTSLIADLSVTGARLLLRQSIPLGQDVKLELFISLEPSEFRVANGRVVRVERLDDSRVSPWYYEAAVEFDQPLTLYAEEIRAMKERQGKLGLHG